MQVFTEVHAKCSSSDTKTVSFGAKAPGVALFAPKGIIVSISSTEFQTFVAQFTLEAGFVPLEATGQHLFGVFLSGKSRPAVTPLPPSPDVSMLSFSAHSTILYRFQLHYNDAIAPGHKRKSLRYANAIFFLNETSPY
ncbi:hypothetical protein TYRP_000710 [Tyrophagus putrescentiae]|nr:hypothetical protein TYRP_000710 [Tyrophagus putrescentiae]